MSSRTNVPGIGKLSLTGVYVISILSTAIGLTVIVILDMFTPLEYILSQLNQGALETQFFWGRLIVWRFFGLLFLFVLSGTLLFLTVHQLLKPIAACLSSEVDVTETRGLALQAKQRLVNLPFMMIPVRL